MKYIILLVLLRSTTTNCSAEITREKYCSTQVFHIANDAVASMGIQIILCMLMPSAAPPFLLYFYMR